MFCKKGRLRNFAKFTGKHLRQSLFFNKVADLRPEACNFIKKETLAQVFSCEFCEISKNIFSTEHLRATASGKGFITKRLVNFEVNTSETIWFEVTISKKKWCIIFVYRPPHSNNKKVFFSELTTSLNQATNKYDNIIVMGGLNIDTQKNGAETNHDLSDLCDTFSLANLIGSSTCFKSLSGTSIDVFRTNRTRSFHNTAIIEPGIGDHHKLITSFFRSHFERITPKKVEYRNYKKFDVTNFFKGHRPRNDSR